MIQLAALQQHFADHCLGKDSAHLPLAGESILHPARLNIYANNIIGSAIDALASTFETVDALVGEEFFNAMATHYVKAHPPTSGNFYDYGSDFHAFIATFTPAQSLPYLADVASYDWAWHQAYCAHNDTALDMDDIQNTTSFVLRHNVQILALTYPAAEIWQFAKEGGDAPDITAGQYYYLLHRPALDVAQTRITQELYIFLTNIMLGKTLQEACNTAESCNEDTDISQLLTSVFSMALLTTSQE